MSQPHAEIVSDSLVWANLRGVDSHGVVRLGRYLEMIDQGLMNVAPNIRSESRAPSAISITADKAPGPVAMRMAADHLLDPARSHGAAVAVVGAMTHTGALGYYTSRLAEAGLASIAMNASVPLMPYHGAAIASLGTNPISFAVPSEAQGRPLVLDMASSVVSMGKLMQARRGAAELEAGWFVDAGGKPTTDPAAAKMPLPLGGAKGSGLSLMIECFTSLLTGSSILAEALRERREPSPHRQSGTIIAIEISAFVSPRVFSQELQRLTALIKALPTVSGEDFVLLPGERGYQCFAQRRVNGIPLARSVWDELNSIAAKYDVGEPAAP